MIFISILILIVAIALPSINKLISPILFTRISSIIFIYAGALSLNAFYIQSIGSGIGIYSGLFQVTTVSQLIDIFIIGTLIIILGLLGSTSKFLSSLNLLVLKLIPNLITPNSLNQTQNLIKFNKFILKFNYFPGIWLSLLIFIILMDILLFNMFMLKNTDYSLNYSYSFYIPDGNSNDTNPTDPVRYWPSGVPQGMSIVGTGLLAFSVLTKLGGCSPRLRVLGALGASGATATTIAYQSALENPVGFNRFMFGLTKFRETGQWPALESIKNQVTETQISEFVNKHIQHANKELVAETANEIKKLIDKGNTFLPESSTDLINKFMDTIFRTTISILKPEYVEGHFDDLIGQQIIIHIILFVLVISLILLFIFYIINNLFLLNKDKIINKFDNKFIKLYIKYQLFLAKLSLIYLPIFILVGLLILCHGFYFLIKYQIPYESLNIDLHTYISSKSKN